MFELWKKMDLVNFGLMHEENAEALLGFQHTSAHGELLTISIASFCPAISVSKAFRRLTIHSVLTCS